MLAADCRSEKTHYCVLAAFWLSVPEMAKYLNIGLNVAYNLTHKPGFPAVRITKCRVVIPVKLLDKWLEENIGL